MMKKILTFIFAILFSVPLRAESLINDTEVESVLSELVTPIATAAKIAPNRMHIYLVDDDSFNAFVIGGEDIYIYTGLLKRVTTPNALRAVVAHELGHTLGGHMAQLSAQMESEMRRAMIIQALGVGLMVLGGNPSLGAGVMAGATGIAKQSLLSFSRDEERVADDLGFNLMVDAGYNPNGFIEIFTQMNEMTSPIESRVNKNSINHPVTAERLKNVREKLADKKISGKKFKDDDAEMVRKYDLVRAKLIGYLDDFARIKTLYPYADKSDAAIYARAIANMRGGNLAGAATGTRTLVSRQPKNPYFYELLGDIEYQFGHYDDSIDAYERAITLRKNSPQIETALALVLSERGENDDPARAIELCRHTILVEPKPLAYWVLARAFGDDGRADWAMAEFYVLTKQPDKAREYARRAKTKLSHDAPEYIKSDDILNQKK